MSASKPHTDPGLLAESISPGGYMPTWEEAALLAYNSLVEQLETLRQAATNVNLEHGHWVSGRKPTGDDFWLALEDGLFPVLHGLPAAYPASKPDSETNASFERALLRTDIRAGNSEAAELQLERLRKAVLEDEAKGTFPHRTSQVLNPASEPHDG